MTDRERLIELTRWVLDGVPWGEITKHTAQDIADHLLANGVIVPPCKVGDKTFLLLEKLIGGWDVVESYCCKIEEKGRGKRYSMFIDCMDIGNTLECDLGDFGQWVFLTKEEAEQALKECEG